MAIYLTLCGLFVLLLPVGLRMNKAGHARRNLKGN